MAYGKVGLLILLAVVMTSTYPLSSRVETFTLPPAAGMMCAFCTLDGGDIFIAKSESAGLRFRCESERDLYRLRDLGRVYYAVAFYLSPRECAFASIVQNFTVSQGNTERAGSVSLIAAIEDRHRAYRSGGFQ